MANNKFNTTKKMLKSKHTPTILEHYGLIENPNIVRKSANFNVYFKTANEITKYLNSGRLDAVNFYQTLKKYRDIAEIFSTENWKLLLKEKYKDRDASLTLHTGPEAPSDKLTRNGNIKPEIVKTLLDDMSNQFDVTEDIPFFIKDLPQKLLKSEKRIVGEMCFNGLGDHDRTCFVRRRILESKLKDNGKTYILVSDEKFYENSPSSVCTLSLVYGAEAQGIAQIARVDTVGHLSPDMPNYLGLYKVEYNMPDYLMRKFEEHHHNVVPGKKYVKISAENHIHIKEPVMELLYALSYMTKATIYKSNPSSFLHMNAKEIDIADFFIDNFSSLIKHQSHYVDSLDLYTKLNKMYVEASLEHDGLVTTDRLEKYYSKAFNITNQTINPDFCRQMDDYRTFRVNKLATIIDPKTIGTQSYPVYEAPKDAIPVVQAEKMKGKIVDFDYVKEHNLTEVIEEYQKNKENNGKSM